MICFQATHTTSAVYVFTLNINASPSDDKLTRFSESLGLIRKTYFPEKMISLAEHEAPIAVAAGKKYLQGIMYDVGLSHR